MSVSNIFDKVLDDDINVLHDTNQEDKQKILLISIIYNRPKVALEAFKNLNYQLNEYTDKDNQHTIIMQAVSYKALDIVQTFIDFGCDATIQNEDGLSAYKIACLMQSIETVKLLEKNNVPYDEDILKTTLLVAQNANLAIHLLNNGAKYGILLGLLQNKISKRNLLNNLDIKDGQLFFELMSKLHEKNLLDSKMKTLDITKSKIKL